MFLRFSILFSLTLCSMSFAVSPNEAFNRLIKGNKRFMQGKSECSDQSPKARIALKSAQEPFAIVVACADSRVAPELLFDQSIGDLFVIRVAGNVIGPYELESVEYAIKHLHASYIVVMGHQNCGAVDAVVKNTVDDITFIAQLIRPSVQKAKKRNSKNILKLATEINAETMLDFVMRSPTISKLQDQGLVGGKAAYYDFSTGQVVFL